MAEFVRCVNGDEILTDWAKALNKKHSDLDAAGVAVEGKEGEGEWCELCVAASMNLIACIVWQWTRTSSARFARTSSRST